MLSLLLLLFLLLLLLLLRGLGNPRAPRALGAPRSLPVSVRLLQQGVSRENQKTRKKDGVTPSVTLCSPAGDTCRA